MGDLWRSEEMQLVQLLIQIDAAHDTVDELGKLGLVQFRDLNSHLNLFQRLRTNEIKRADEMLRKLRTFARHIDQFNKEAIAERLLNQVIVVDENQPEPALQHMDELEVKFDEYDKKMKELLDHQEQLNRNYSTYLELRNVINFVETIRQETQDQGIGMTTDETGQSLLLTEEGKFQVKFGSLSGVVLRSEFHLMEKMLFRVTRGNLFMKHAEIPEDVKDPITGEMTQKNVFIVFYQGDRLKQRIEKSFESFSVNKYTCPETSSERKGLLEQLNSKLESLKEVLDRGWDQRSQTLNHIAQQLFHWTNRVTKEKMIYHTLNKFNYDLGRKCLIAEGWCPVSAIEGVTLALRRGRERSGALIPSILQPKTTTETPPTFFHTDYITTGFQNIVESYGVARYREVNPAVFTCVTFPFEFGIMFGDVGHGVMLLIAAAWLIYMERHWEGKKINEMFQMVYNGRYTIFLMALFAIYIGSLYNELFALPMNFGSNWVLQMGANSTDGSFYPRDLHWTYVWGVDPIWKGASNELMYYNSLKMKGAVIIGVMQMTLGLFLHAANSIYFKNWLDFFFEFLPRLVFLMATFGYLCFMIFLKWNTEYLPDPDRGIPDRTPSAPVLLNELIYMFLPPPAGAKEFYSGQYAVQGVLKILIYLSIPLMWIPKPLMIWLYHNAEEGGYPTLWAYLFGPKRQPIVSHVESDDGGDKDDNAQVALDAPAPAAGGHGGHGHGEFDISEVIVHQSLETIEFVLGCISHTASYLRLWALSLAHSELATVFWDKIWGTLWGLAYDEHAPGHGLFLKAVMSFAAYSAWMLATILVLMFMEVLSAFLHALRLHWVEFQSKFYRGDGHAFQPFSYAAGTGGDHD